MVTTTERASARLAAMKMSDEALMEFLREMWRAPLYRRASSAELLLTEEVEVEAIIRRLPELLALFPDELW